MGGLDTMDRQILALAAITGAFVQWGQGATLLGIIASALVWLTGALVLLRLTASR